jgi:hypothetical protein
LNKANIVLLLFFSLLLVGGQIGSVFQSQATTDTYRVSVSSPALTSTFGEELPGVIAGQEVMLNIQLQGARSEDFVVIIEIRDLRGVTQGIMSQAGTITAGEPTDIRISWKAIESGDFYAKAFVISSLEKPEVLSTVSGTNVKVVTTAAQLEDLFPELQIEIPIDTEPDDVPPKPAAYTFMVYMVASNLESTGYYATHDVMEMMSVGSTENVNVIIQTGGSANSTVDDFRFIDFTEVQRHEVLKDEVKTVQKLGKRNMASAATLRDFASWGLQNYPAEKHVIILWDHGAGMIGFGYDDIYGDILDLAEIREGLYPAVQHGKQFEVIGFDACLMASIEVANALTGRGKYLVASEELEPAWGMDFAAILASIDENPQQDGVALGKVISDSYLAHARENSDQFADYRVDPLLTMSVIELDKIPALYEEVRTAGDYLDRRGGTTETTLALTKMIRGTERYGESGRSSTGHLDLYNLAQNIDREFPDAAGMGSKIMTRVDDAVVYSVGGEARQDSHGLSIFMQVEEYPANAPYLKYIVGKWISVLTSTRENLNQDSSPPDVSLSMGKDKVVTGTISGDDVSYVATYVTQNEESDNIRIKILSVVYEDAADFIKADGSVTYDWSRSIMSLCNEGEQDCRPTSITYEQNGRTEFAYVPVRLESDRFNGTVFLIYAVSDGTFEFLGGWPGVDESGSAQRDLVPLIAGDRVYPFTYLYEEDINTQESSFDLVEDPTPIVVSDGFGPDLHRYTGEYVLTFYACDFSENCGYSRDFEYNIE